MKDNNQKADKNRIMTLTIVMLCVLAIAIGLYKSIAAYITVSNMKAVAATNENEELFNSNYLYGYKSSSFSYETRLIELNPSDGQETVSFILRIFNHNKEDINIINPNTVKYNLTIEVNNTSNDVSGYEISNTTQNGSTFTHEGATLQGRTANSHSYLITMPSSDLGKVSLNVKAIVDRTGGNAGTDLFALAARLEPCRNASVASPSVKGSLVHVKSDSIKDYVAFNYEVTVGGAESLVELTWDENYFEIDPFFAKDFKISGNPGKATVKLPVGTRVIQFYRIKGLSEPSDWGDDLGFSVKKASS